MDNINLLKVSKMVEMGIISNNTTTLSKDYSIFNAVAKVTISSPRRSISTRFNNSQRFSLELLKLNKRKLNTIKSLKVGWNGYEGEEISSEVISRTERIISELEYQPQIFPTGRGSIQLERYLDDNNFVEIEISKNEVFVFMVKNGEETEKSISLSEINELINAL